jgi:hypothetical protein
MCEEYEPLDPQILAEFLYEPEKFWKRFYDVIFKKEPYWEIRKKD